MAWRFEWITRWFAKRPPEKLHVSVTQSQQAALDALYQRVPMHARWFPSSGLIGVPMPVEEAVRILAAADPAEMILELVSFRWRSPTDLARPLSDLILTLASRLPAGSWPRLDEQIRQRLMLFVNDTELPSPVDPGLIVLAICHPSGWIREKAIGLAGILPNQTVVSMLLVRINDWARQVRHRAELMLSPSMAKLNPEQKMALVPLVDRLRYCGRLDQSKALEAWRISLITPFDENEWLKSWDRSQGRDRRVYLELLKQTGRIPGETVRKALLKSNDRMALLWYLKEVLPKLEGNDREEATEAITRSRAVPVRRAWLEKLLENQPIEAVPVLVETLMESSRSLRHFARFYLSRLAPMDFAAHYRSALNSPRVENVALRGLTEVSATEGHLEAVRRLASSDSRVQKAAIESLAADQLGDHLDRLLEIAGQAESGASKAARKRLLEIAPLLGIHLLSNPNAIAASPADLQLHFIRLAPFFGKWQGLDYLLQQLLESGLREEKIEGLRVWMLRGGQSFIKLKGEQRSGLLNLLDELNLPDSLREDLRFIVKRAE